MSGVKKAGKKAFKGVSNIVKGAWEGSKKVGDALTHPRSTVKKLAGAVSPEVPGPADMPDAPLMPDYELLDKAKRRGRARKMGRSDTIMSETLG